MPQRVLKFPTIGRRSPRGPSATLAVQTLTRGVYVAPWFGPNGETVLIAIQADGREVCPPRLIPADTSTIIVTDSLWQLLDRFDPVGSAVRSDTGRLC